MLFSEDVELHDHRSQLMLAFMKKLYPQEFLEVEVMHDVVHDL